MFWLRLFWVEMVAFPVLALYLLSQVPTGTAYRTLNIVVYGSVLVATAVGFWYTRRSQPDSDETVADQN
jgi:hypothetical protein